MAGGSLAGMDAVRVIGLSMARAQGHQVRQGPSCGLLQRGRRWARGGGQTEERDGASVPPRGEERRVRLCKAHDSAGAGVRRATLPHAPRRWWARALGPARPCSRGSWRSRIAPLAASRSTATCAPPCRVSTRSATWRPSRCSGRAGGWLGEGGCGEGRPPASARERRRMAATAPRCPRRQEHVTHARLSAAHAVSHIMDPGNTPAYDYLPFFYSREFHLSWQFYGRQVGEPLGESRFH